MANYCIKSDTMTQRGAHEFCLRNENLNANSVSCQTICYQNLLEYLQLASVKLLIKQIANPMNFALLILGPPYSTQASASALRFARAALNGGHSIYRLFFYHDGVHNASALVTTPQDENSLPQQWSELIEQHQLDSVVCIAAATRRGVLNEQEAKRFGKTGGNLSPGHEVSGLGQLVDASLNADRVMTFG